MKTMLSLNNCAVLAGAMLFTLTILPGWINISPLGTSDEFRSHIYYLSYATSYNTEDETDKDFVDCRLQYGSSGYHSK